jgi:hypothetical protein
MPGSNAYNHGEVGVFGDYFRISPDGGDAINYVGLGARVGFNVFRYGALEAEMSYDFERTNVTTSTSGGMISTFSARIRPITGLFGPKFQIGSTGPVRAFIVAKAGFVQFTTNCDAPAGSPGCFATSLSGFGGDSTHFAAFPGGGIEFFAGPFGLRMEAGDEIWVNNGAHNNLRVTFGPAIRF